LSKTITVPVKRLSALLCNYRMLASIMVELKYGSLSILGHILRNKIPIVGNQGESEGYDRRGAKKTPLFQNCTSRWISGGLGGESVLRRCCLSDGRGNLYTATTTLILATFFCAC